MDWARLLGRTIEKTWENNRFKQFNQLKPKSQTEPNPMVLGPIEHTELAFLFRSHCPFGCWWLCHWLLEVSSGGIFETPSRRSLAQSPTRRTATEAARPPVELFGTGHGDSWTGRGPTWRPKSLHLWRHPSIPDTIDPIPGQWSSAVRGSLLVRRSWDLCVHRYGSVHHWTMKPSSAWSLVVLCPECLDERWQKPGDWGHWLSDLSHLSWCHWCLDVRDSRSRPKGSSSPLSVAQLPSRQGLYASRLSSVEVRYASIPVSLEPLEPHIIWAKWPGNAG